VELSIWTGCFGTDYSSIQNSGFATRPKIERSSRTWNESGLYTLEIATVAIGDEEETYLCCKHLVARSELTRELGHQVRNPEPRSLQHPHHPIHHVQSPPFLPRDDIYGLGRLPYKIFKGPSSCCCMDRDMQQERRKRLRPPASDIRCILL
jgi:hypothetical protein